MKKIAVGDKVRFLNTVGGGIVKGFQNKQIVIVEDEHGFDVPVLIKECIVIESTVDEKMGQASEEENENTSETLSSTFNKRSATYSDDPRQGMQDKVGAGTTELIEETPEGENITACLAYLPMDIKSLSTTSYECYFVNDSNYYLFFNYMSRENNTWKSRYSGSIEPNTKIFLEEFDKSALNDIEMTAVQFIAFKHEKQYKFKNACSVELRIDTVKFYKLHSFTENDYFDEDALIYYIIQDDVPTRELLVSAGDIERAIKEKDYSRQRPKSEPALKRKRKKDSIIEVDLHIQELVDTTAGMNNKDILEYQLNKVNEVMKENINHKNRKIVFIHGKGDGVLKNALVQEIKKKYPLCYFQDASFQEYGFGATMVTIK